ncbi:transcriptional regulator family: Fungal Specific TF [Penicillium macrosclerotiorum]|uniref:transcriptional regulator family: Fungal Specific TF n=1 Tax=Penicillium macrosclerotiorum TaxID=303699 RepID=UPI00254660F1|nr:transcriptional regulator family: Fungal Specific TF [Penicillium macrosclerotiorum]KAJ5669419.1 transcriptional regulator family: Fungal Specific TF [Penicillium macrosclerotiorum]
MTLEERFSRSRTDVRLVSSNVPALDGPENPYRQLSFTALSSPVLLETVVCIATEHMLNFGLGNVSTAAQHQQRMLGTIGQNLRMIETGGDCETECIVTANKLDYEALLTAVVLQGVVVAQSEDGVLEPHVRCASFLMRALDRFHQIPHSALSRMTVQRFAMVDVMLAFSRQRRPYAPRSFVLHQPDSERWDNTEPSFHKMTGCPQPLMCFFVQISHLACDVDNGLESRAPTDGILTQAHRLETELRSWGARYTGVAPGACTRPPLDILTECFYWTAHLLLARRVFRDPTRSPRVQHLAHTCFGLMNQLSTGCGPDSSLPQPFYLAAREAISIEDRVWVRQKHESMTDFYREQQRNTVMRLTERIWEIMDQVQSISLPGLDLETCISKAEEQIRSLDQQSCQFIF